MDPSLSFILLYMKRVFFCNGVQMPEARPQMHGVVGADSEKDVHSTQLANGKVSVLFLAFGSSISIQLEGGSIWILAFR